MNKRKILIVDTNYAVIPLIDFLKQNGYELGVIGKFCSKYIREKVDAHHKVDYSKLGKLRDVVDSYGYDYVIPGCTDLSYMQCSHLKRKEVDETRIIRKLHEKKNFKSVLNALGIPTSQSYSEYGALKQKQQLIYKPIDSFSGMGVSIVPRNADNLTKAIAIEHAKSHSNLKGVIVEDYFLGDLYSVSSIWDGKKIIREIYVREFGLANEFRVDYSYIDSDFAKTQMAAKIKDDLNRIATFLKLKPGLFHIQFIKNNNSYIIVECMRRLPGDLYARLIEIDSDWQYSRDYVSALIGKDIREIAKKHITIYSTHVRVTVSYIHHKRKLLSELALMGLRYSEYSNKRNEPNFRSTFFVEANNCQGFREVIRKIVSSK